MSVADRSIDKCQCCDETAVVRLYSVRGVVLCGGRLDTPETKIQAAMLCDMCAEIWEKFVVSNEELRILASRKHP